MIKNIVFALFLLGLNTLLTAQTYQEAITLKMNRFIELSNQADWENAFDLMYPKLFETVSKAELISMMDQMAENGVEIKTKSHKIDSFSELVSNDDEDFVLVEYDAVQALKMAEALVADETQRGAMIFNLKSMFGSSSVTFDDASKAFIINAKKSMFAVSKKGIGEWYLVENNEEQKELMDALIPLEIQEKLSK